MHKWREREREREEKEGLFDLRVRASKSEEERERKYEAKQGVMGVYIGNIGPTSPASHFLRSPLNFLPVFFFFFSIL